MPIYVSDDESDGEWGLDAGCSPETLGAAASEGTQLEALEGDVAKPYVGHSHAPKP